MKSKPYLAFPRARPRPPLPTTTATSRTTSAPPRAPPGASSPGGSSSRARARSRRGSRWRRRTMPIREGSTGRSTAEDRPRRRGRPRCYPRRCRHLPLHPGETSKEIPMLNVSPPVTSLQFSGIRTLKPNTGAWVEGATTTTTLPLSPPP